MYNITYEENFLDLRLSKEARGMNVSIPSLNVRVYARRANGQFMSMLEAQTKFALFFTYARADLFDKFAERSIDKDDYLIQRTNSLIKSFFCGGEALRRTPYQWRGV